MCVQVLEELARNSSCSETWVVVVDQRALQRQTAFQFSADGRGANWEI